jgi:thiamine kinase-like enzyme
MKSSDIKAVLDRLTNDESLELFNDDVLNYRVIKVHKRRLSKVYVVHVTLARLGSKKVCIKQLTKTGVDSIEDNKQKVSLHNEFASNLRAYQNFKANNSPYIVVKPLCVIPEIFIIVTEFFENSMTLEDLLTQKFNWNNEAQFNQLKGLMHKAGELLTTYQKSGAKVTGSPDEQISELIPYLIVRIELIYEFFNDKKLDHLLNRTAKDISLEFKKIPHHILHSSGELVKTHGDYTPANVLYSENKLALIDFSESRNSSRFYDVGSFINYIRMLPLNKKSYDSGKAQELISSYISGYNNKTADSQILEELFKFRYLTTNLLTQIYESREGVLKSIFLMPRIKRYMKTFEEFSLNNILPPIQSSKE